MPRIKAINNYHGSEGYKHAGQEWEVSEEEAKGLIAQGSVTLVEKKAKSIHSGAKEEKAPVATKEDKSSVTTKEEKPEGPKTITTANVKTEE